MQHDSFVTDLAIVLGVAGLTGFIFRLLRQPSILGYLFAGMIVGPFIPVPLFADPKRVHALSEFGVVLVMFAVGLEFRLQKFFRVLPVSGLTGLIEISTLFFGGYLLGQAIGWTEIGSLFLGACVCISSTMAVSKVFEQQPASEDVRESVFGVLVLQDVAAIALIAVMTALSRGANAALGDVLLLLGKLLAVLVLIVVLGMFVIPRGVRWFEKTRSTETLVVGSIGLCFALALLAEKLGYSSALGAFLAGILVAESGLGKKVEDKTKSVRDVFAAVFFVSIGMSVDPTLAWEHLPTSCLVLALVIGLQFVSVTFGGLLSGNGLRRSVAAGLALGQIGEFAFILAQLGRDAYVVRQELQPILVTVAVLSTFTTALLLRFAEPITFAVERILPGRARRLLSIYESWFERLRTRSGGKSSGTVLILRAVVVDVLLAAAIIFAFRIWQSEIELTLIRRFHLGPQLVTTVASLVLGLALLPVLVLLTATAYKLSRKLTQLVLPKNNSSARAFLQAALVFVIVVSVGLVAAGLLAPVVGAVYAWVTFSFTLLAALAILWQRAGALDHEITSGSELLMQAIAEQSMPEEERHTEQPSVLPQNLREFTLHDGHFALGRSLSDLKLRSMTGASVLAVRAAQGSAQSPTGTEILSVGETLFIAGCNVDQDAAVELLSTGQLNRNASTP